MNAELTLREQNLKVTMPRLKVLEYLAGKGPVTALEVQEKLGLDKVTVYRTLQTFEESGIVRSVELGKRSKYFELDHADDHHHITCIRCGEIEAVHMCPVEDIEKQVLRSSKQFTELASHMLEFQGVCKSCS
jgi:Fur family ferric uptake transcriptional regulator